MIALTSSSAAPTWADDETLEVYEQNGISYVSGGIGKDESDALQSMQHNYNLRIMNADKAGHFSGDTRIVISDMKQVVLLDDNSGPLFYANLPKGRYVVEGFSQEQSKRQTVVITGEKAAHVRFVWPQDADNINNY